jgi:hypothetical protein
MKIDDEEKNPNPEFCFKNNYVWSVFGLPK